MHYSFEAFLINEGRAYLGEKIGDLLTSLQNLQDDADGMTKHAIERALLRDVGHIRRILRGRWDDVDRPHLELIQKVGNGIMLGLEETDGDLPELVASAVAELESLAGKLEEPLNSLGAERGAVDAEREEEVDSGSSPEELGTE